MKNHLNFLVFKREGELFFLVLMVNFWDLLLFKEFKLHFLL
jgi:hypothetical protein